MKTLSKRFEEVLERAMTSASVIGTEYHKNHSLAWDEEKKYFLQELITAVKERDKEVLGEDESIDSANDEFDKSYNARIRRENILRKQIRMKMEESY